MDEGTKKPFKLLHSPSLLTGKTWNDHFGLRVISDEDWVHEHVLVELALGLPLPSEGMVVAALQDRPANKRPLVMENTLTVLDAHEISIASIE